MAGHTARRTEAGAQAWRGAASAGRAVAAKRSVDLDPTLRRDLEALVEPVTTLAIANHEMAKRAFPDRFSDEEDDAEVAPGSARCGYINPNDEARACTGEMGHRGAHRLRSVTGSPFWIMRSEVNRR